jgi:hypothetical protein
MKKSIEYTNALCLINNMILGEKVRITTKIAKALLLNNHHVTIGGNQYGLCIRSLGLGVCSVELNSGNPHTFMARK